jgi:hypothetical protein
MISAKEIGLKLIRIKAQNALKFIPGKALKNDVLLFVVSEDSLSTWAPVRYHWHFIGRTPVHTAGKNQPGPEPL